MSTDNRRAAVKEFKQAVNTSPKALAAWLETPESKAASWRYQQHPLALFADELGP